jgi:hypothetical protein
MSEEGEDQVSLKHEPKPQYEPPRVTVLGAVHELTQGCDKTYGSSDGFTFQGQAIMCNTST